MSELEAVVGQAVPLIGAAVGAYGAEVLTRVEAAAADATVGLGARLLDRIRRRTGKPAAVDAAVADLAGSPGDSDALSALRFQVRKALTEDPQLLAEIAEMIPARGAVAVEGNRSVGIGGNNTGIVVTGDGATTIQRQ